MYAKVFSQIYDGTLVTKGPWQALVTFQQLLVLADQDGAVDMTALAISRRTTIPIEIIDIGIAELLKEDPDSRTPDQGGRRIIPLRDGRSWGWLVVNYKHYRALKREEDRRSYHRDYWHKRKETQQTQQTQQNQPIAEAEAKAKAEEEIQALRAMSPANAADLRADASPEENTRPQKPSIPATPYQSIVDAYHAALPTLPQVRLMSEARKKGIARLWKFAFTSKKPDGTPRATNADEALKWIGFYFIRAKQNEFLMGKNGRTGTHANWMPDIDFLTTDKGMSQVIEKT